MQCACEALTVELAELRQSRGAHPDLEVLVGDANHRRDVVGVRLVQVLHGVVVGVVKVVLGAGGRVLVVLAVIGQALLRAGVRRGGHHLRINLIKEKKKNMERTLPVRGEPKLSPGGITTQVMGGRKSHFYLGLESLGLLELFLVAGPGNVAAVHAHCAGVAGRVVQGEHILQEENETIESRDW